MKGGVVRGFDAASASRCLVGEGKKNDDFNIKQRRGVQFSLPDLATDVSAGGRL